jgi:hypothetical protein
MRHALCRRPDRRKLLSCGILPTLDVPSLRYPATNGQISSPFAFHNVMNSQSPHLRNSYAASRMEKAIERTLCSGNSKEREMATRWAASWGLLCGMEDRHADVRSEVEIPPVKRPRPSPRPPELLPSTSTDARGPSLPSIVTARESATASGEQSGQEKRAHKRKLMHEPASIDTAVPGKWNPVILLDISTGGVSFAAAEALVQGNKYTLRFCLPHSDHLHQIAIRIMHVGTTGVPTGFRMGARFLDANVNATDAIVEFFSKSPD